MKFWVTWKSEGYTFDAPYETEDEANTRASNLRADPTVANVAVFPAESYSPRP
jgi:hypothetical protein